MSYLPKEITDNFFKMLTIEFINDGSEKEAPTIVGNYDVTVLVNGKVISKLRVEDHNRLSGWEGLVSCLAKQVWQDPD